MDDQEKYQYVLSEIWDSSSSCSSSSSSSSSSLSSFSWRSKNDVAEGDYNDDKMERPKQSHPEQVIMTKIPRSSTATMTTTTTTTTVVSSVGPHAALESFLIRHPEVLSTVRDEQGNTLLHRTLMMKLPCGRRNSRSSSSSNHYSSSTRPHPFCDHAASSPSGAFVSLVQLIAKRHPSAIVQANDAGLTPLHLAMMKDSTDSLGLFSFFLQVCPQPEQMLLLRYGTASTGQKTLLLYACERPKLQPAMIQQLVERCPLSLTMPDTVHGITPLHAILRHGDTNDLKQLARFHRHDGYFELLGRMLHTYEQYRDQTPYSLPNLLQLQDESGDTPLHTACWLKAPHSVIQLLVHHAIDKENGMVPGALGLPNARGNVPLHFALMDPVRQYHPVMVPLSPTLQLLVDAYPEAILHVNQFGETPLHVVCRNHRSSIMMMAPTSTTATSAMTAAERKKNAKYPNGKADRQTNGNPSFPSTRSCDPCSSSCRTVEFLLKRAATIIPLSVLLCQHDHLGDRQYQYRADLDRVGDANTDVAIPGATPLFLALAHELSTDVVQCLLQACPQTVRLSGFCCSAAGTVSSSSAAGCYDTVLGMACRRQNALPLDMIQDMVEHWPMACLLPSGPHGLLPYEIAAQKAIAAAYQVAGEDGEDDDFNFDVSSSNESSKLADYLYRATQDVVLAFLEVVRMDDWKPHRDLNPDAADESNNPWLDILQDAAAALKGDSSAVTKLAAMDHQTSFLVWNDTIRPLLHRCHDLVYRITHHPATQSLLPTVPDLPLHNHARLVDGIFLMNQAGRDYIRRGMANNKQQGVNVLQAVSDNWHALFLHVRENPLLCSRC